MNAIFILSIISILLILFLGLVVFLKNPKNKKNQLLSLLSLCIFIWIITVMMSDASKEYHQALFWTKSAIIGPALIPLLLLWFSYIFPIKKEKISKLKVFLLSLPTLIILLLSPTALNIKKITITDWGTDLTPGPLYIFLLILLIIYIGITLYNLIVSYKKTQGREKYQIKYLFLGISITLILGVIANLILPLYGYGRASSIGPASSLFFVAFTGYAITRYRFMDIRIFAGKIITYILVASFAYGAFYGIILFNNSVFGSVYAAGAYLIGIIFAIAFVIIFYPLQKLIQKITKHYLFAEVYNAQEVISSLTNKLTTIIDLKQIIDLIVDTIRATMNLDRSGVLLIENATKPIKYQIVKVVGFDEHNGISLVQDSFLTQYLAKNQKPLVREELDFLSEQAKNKDEKQSFLILKNHMHKIEASICLPLISQNMLLGIIVLGSKMSGDAYTNEDLHLLNSLSYQASVAIENARLYQQVQDFNKTLQTKVDEQTKDIQNKAIHLEKLLKMRSEFLDIASHQLRTPTSVIKGTLAMMQDGDMDKMSTEEKAKFVRNMFQKSVKLESIINDILVASEMDTAEFSIRVKDTIELEKFLEKEVADHQFDALEKKLALTYEKLSDGPFKIKGSAKYLEQVIDNLLSNAMKYTPQGTVKASIKRIGQNVIVSVSDTGIGIPKEDIKRIFNKFIRGKNARNVYTDGSGLGLFIIKRVMDKHLGSKIWVESEEGKGSSFYLQFPLINT